MIGTVSCFGSNFFSDNNIFHSKYLTDNFIWSVLLNYGFLMSLYLFVVMWFNNICALLFLVSNKVREIYLEISKS